MMALTLIACTVIFIMVCVIFEDSPKYAPSLARQRSLSSRAAVQNQTTKEVLKSYIRLLSSRNFILLCVGYGLLVGSYYALSGNINKLVTPNLGDSIEHQEKAQHAGKMGLIMILSGSLASLAAGCILDAAKKYKVISKFATIRGFSIIEQKYFQTFLKIRCFIEKNNLRGQILYDIFHYIFSNDERHIILKFKIEP